MRRRCEECLVLLIMVVITTGTRWRAWSAIVRRFAAAAVAGLASGLVAGAVVVALRGTDWGLNAANGDSGTLLAFARRALETGSTLKVFQIGLTALFGPTVYLVWQPLLVPVWALGIGIVLALPLIDPYKPYSNLTLVLMIPVVLALPHILRRSGERSWRRTHSAGAARDRCGSAPATGTCRSPTTPPACFAFTAQLIRLPHRGW